MKNLPHRVEPALAERLRMMAAVVVTGARQAGRSTLVAQVLERAGTAHH